MKRIYRNRENRSYCKERWIRLSGPKFGRPKADEIKENRRLEYQDAGERNAVEGKFGEAKRVYKLDRIFAKLPETGKTVIAMQLLVMNLERMLRLLLCFFQNMLVLLKFRKKKQGFQNGDLFSKP